MLGFFKWPVTAVIVQKRANGYNVVIDKAKRINKQGAEFYRLKRAKKNIKPQDLGDIYSTHDKNYLFLLESQSGEYKPLKINEGELKARDESWDYFKFYADAETRFKYDRMGKWEKFLPLFIIFITGLAVTMVLYVSLPLIIEHLNAVSGSWINAINQNTQAQNQILEALKGTVSNPPAY